MTEPPMCQVCRREKGVKLVFTARKRRRLWKCQSCLDHTSVSFLHIKPRTIK
jgi:ribosomal protein L37AE/L43A